MAVEEHAPDACVVRLKAGVNPLHLAPSLARVGRPTQTCSLTWRRDGGLEAGAYHVRLRWSRGRGSPVHDSHVVRIAARALLGAPEIVIADEPTSALDAAHRRDFIDLLFKECRKEDTSLVFVSHDTSLAPLFDRTVQLVDINRAGSY